MKQNHTTLVYLQAQDAERLRLRHLKGVSLKIADDIVALKCRFESVEGYYLIVTVSYKSGGKKHTIEMMIPHSIVLLVIQSTDKTSVGFNA